VPGSTERKGDVRLNVELFTTKFRDPAVVNVTRKVPTPEVRGAVEGAVAPSLKVKLTEEAWDVATFP
jgi:hypothetical protein